MNRAVPHSAAKKVDDITYKLDHANGWFPEAKLHKRYGYWYAPSSVIYKEAVKRRVPPELLVDEELYFQRSGGVAAYRLLFECYKKGLRMSDVLAAADNTFGMKVNATTWKNFLEGYVKIGRDTKTRYRYAGISLGYLMTVCEILDFPISSVFRTVRMGGITNRPEGRGIYGGLHKVIEMLDDADLAVLVGVGVFLATNDEKIIRAGFDHLLAWWGGHSRGK